MDEVKNIENVTTNEESYGDPKDYKIIIDMIKEMESQYDTLVTSLKETMKTKYNLEPTVLDMILPFEKNEIPNMDPELIRDFLMKYTINAEHSVMDENELRDVMMQVKDASLLILSSKEELKALKNDSVDILKEYFNYLSSDKIKEQRQKNIDALKCALDMESDPDKKKELEKKINILSSSLDFSFLYERFNKYGKKEIDNIKDAFFEIKKGSYIIDKFKNKIHLFGYKDTLYQAFFNIEENFLDKKYSPFNNLFLFIYMRQIAYSDPYDKKDKMFISSITGAIANLIYHKFESTENEMMFKKVIESIDDKFEEYRDYFIENNTSYEEHPVRKAAEAKHDANKREALKRVMKDMNIEGYDGNLSTKELQEVYERESEKMIQKQLDEMKTEKDSSLMQSIIEYNEWKLPEFNEESGVDAPFITDKDGNDVMSVEEFQTKYHNGDFNDVINKIRNVEVSYDNDDVLNINPSIKPNNTEE